jgi:hypothetical protein
VGEWGPVIHFESHGIESASWDKVSPDTQDSLSMSGLGREGSREDLLREGVASPFRLLNLATNFWLLALRAAAYAEGTAPRRTEKRKTSVIPANLGYAGI